MERFHGGAVLRKKVGEGREWKNCNGFRPARGFSQAFPSPSLSRRTITIKAACASGGYTMQEIGDYFGLHHSRISEIIRDVPGRSGEAQVET
jgi:hypothetical protein